MSRIGLGSHTSRADNSLEHDHCYRSKSFHSHLVRSIQLQHYYIVRIRIGLVVTFPTTSYFIVYSRGPAPAWRPDLLGPINRNDIFNKLHAQPVRRLNMIPQLL